MAKQGKRYTTAKELIERNQFYDPNEALALVQKSATAKFDETIEIAVKLGVNPRHADQQVRGAVTMPAGLGRTVRILVFAKDDLAEAAREAGADIIGDEETAAEIQKGWMDFDLVLATPDMMRVVGRLGRVLGPRGLMPNPKAGTVTADIAEAVKEFKAGKIEYRVERAGIVHAPIGKASFSLEDLMINFRALMAALMRARPAAAKGQYVRSVTVSSTMGPGVKVNTQKASE